MNSDLVQKNINKFLSQVETQICNSLVAEKDRFPSCDKLLNKFNNQSATWKIKGADLTNDIVAMTNELCLARLILERLKCNRLEYEPIPALNNTQKTIDFRISMDNGNTIYCDIKTVQPREQDDWEKFEQHKRFFPNNTEVILDNKWLGGEIWHNWYNSRGAFLTYTREFENKISTYDIADNTYFAMIFCSDGFDWRVNHLEDFADFYFTKRHNPDDKFSVMEDEFIRDEKITFLRNINRFAYFERPKIDIKETDFICPVRGPWIENRWVSC